MGLKVSTDEPLSSESPQPPAPSTYVLEGSSNVPSFPLCPKKHRGSEEEIFAVPKN